MTFPIPRSILIFTLIIVMNSSLFGKGLSYINLASDSIVKVTGHVYDTLNTPNAILPLKARIIFQSLPHGNEIGIITSDNLGYYEYFLNLSYTYSISVECENHRKFVEVFDPRLAITDSGISHNFYLEPELKQNQVIRLEKLIFEQGKAAITTISFQELNRLVAIMQEKPGLQVQLEGHTDYRGDKKLNLELSKQRVDAVKSYLVSKGISQGRIKTKAFGGSKPLIREQSIEASEINRRVEVRILKL